MARSPTDLSLDRDSGRARGPPVDPQFGNLPGCHRESGSSGASRFLAAGLRRDSDVSSRGIGNRYARLGNGDVGRGYDIPP